MAEATDIDGMLPGSLEMHTFRNTGMEEVTADKKGIQCSLKEGEKSILCIYMTGGSVER